MKIAVLIPYLPEDSTEALFDRCKASLDPRFHVLCRIDKEHKGVSVMRNNALFYLFEKYQVF